MASLAGALLAGGLASIAVSAPAGAAPDPDAEPADLASRFTFAVLPDTQFYSRYSAAEFVPRYGTNPFAEQTRWLAEHRAELRIPFVAHLGDIVDQAGQRGEWEAADRAMQVLDDADLPYSILPGNHDVTNSGVWDTQLGPNEPFNTWFGPARAAEQSTYGGTDPTGRSQFHLFEAEGQQFMSLALSWNPSDATLAWAQSVIDAHPTVPVILTNHALINVGTDQTTPVETGDSTRMWDELIRKNDQIFLTLNGHFHGATRQVRTNDFGHPVHQILMDYQMAYEGGNGYLGLLEFDLTNNSISLETGSPWVVFKPQETLTSYDQPLLEGVHQRYTLDLDFRERFAGFAPDFTAGTPDEPPLREAARAILLDGFEGPDPIGLAEPGSTDDYVEPEGTLAHWRFNGEEGVVGADTVIEDVAGDSDLTRPDPASTASVGSTWEDVTVESTDVHRFSSDGAAVCFDNSSGSRFSYLTTAPDAPINSADLSQGFTLETFVKMDADWDAASNGWSKFLVRTGNRKTMGMPQTRWDWTASPTALGISNLREFQFTSLPSNSWSDKTNWSGEIMPDTWSHVALVNDPVRSTTTMYVDGAPVLRNASSATGMKGAGLPWILGADWVDDAARNGWHGCIGETRIIDRPTTPEEWLTARPAIDGLTVTDRPDAILEVGTTEATFAGTGRPGATVTLGGSDVHGSTVVAQDGTWTLTSPIDPRRGDVRSWSVRQGYGSRTVVGAEGSYRVLTPTEPPLADPVFPAAVTFVDEPGTDRDRYVVPRTTGVTYRVAGQPVAAGSYPGTGTVTITAVASGAAPIAEGATTSWTHTFSAEAPVVVEPVTMTLAAEGRTYGRASTVTGQLRAASGPVAGAATVFVDGVDRGQVSITDGTFSIDLAPDLAAGAHQVRVRYAGSETTEAAEGRVEVRIARARSAVSIELDATRPTRRARVTGTVEVALRDGSAPVTGVVVLKVAGRTVDALTLTDGAAEFRLPRLAKRGRMQVTAVFLGSDSVAQGRAKATLTVRR